MLLPNTSISLTNETNHNDKKNCCIVNTLVVKYIVW